MARRLAAAVAAAFLIAVAPASATTGTYTCAQLQGALDPATIHTGDVITLTEMCHGQSFTLPNFDTPGLGETYVSWTLNGTPGAGFDGDGTVRPLVGTDVHSLEIDDLTFTDGKAPGSGNGGAISIDGESAVIIRRSTFLRNQATTGRGGAVYLAPGQELAPS
jgi:hypothetical protein